MRMVNLHMEELVRRIGNADAKEQRVIAAQIPTPVLFKELEARSAYMENQLAEIRGIFNDAGSVKSVDQEGEGK